MALDIGPHALGGLVQALEWEKWETSLPPSTTLSSEFLRLVPYPVDKKLQDVAGETAQPKVGY